MNKYQKAIKKYMKKKNKWGIETFGHPFCTKEELEYLLNDSEVDFKRVIEDMDFTSENAVDVCPHCVSYKLKCYLCPISNRTDNCKEHPITKTLLNYWIDVERKFFSSPEMEKAFNKLKKVLK